MTNDQKIQLQIAISNLVRASEELGAVDRSYGWNEKYFKQQEAQKLVNRLINEMADAQSGRAA